MKTDLSGRVALVTGAGTGIGKAIAIDLAEAGACVLTCGRRKELLEQTLSELGGANNGRSYAADLTDPCLLYTSPSPRDRSLSRMPSSA